MAEQPRMESSKPLQLKQQPTSDTAKEAAAALRAQAQLELQNLKQCAYKVFDCTEWTLEGYNFCLRHILQDKNAPYKQCSFVYSTNGKRCHLPAPKDTGYCTEHALKTHLTSSKRGSHYQPPRTAEVLLHSLSHYIKRPRTRTLSASTQYSDEGRSSPDDESMVTKCLDPFTEIDSNGILASGSEVLDMCSESESDVDATSFGSVWHDAHAESSDNDSIDSEQEDVLKHANVYSAEEVTLITRDKLMRLQSLYIDQYCYLHHILREQRRRYLFALKREKETCCSITNQVHDTPKEQRMYKKLKAFNSYRKKHGVEAICNKRLYERRLKATEGAGPKSHSYSKCVFTEGGVKCGERALPVTRHCRKHILEDPNQILFRACSKVKGDMECTTPIEAIFDDTTCRLHMDIPPIRSYAQVRKDSESDYDDALEVQMSTSQNVETIAGAQDSIKMEIGDFKTETNSMDTFEVKEEIVKNEDSTEHSEFFAPHTDTADPHRDGSSNTENNHSESTLSADLDFLDTTSKEDQTMEQEVNYTAEVVTDVAPVDDKLEIGDFPVEAMHDKIQIEAPAEAVSTEIVTETPTEVPDVISEVSAEEVPVPVCTEDAPFVKEVAPQEGKQHGVEGAVDKQVELNSDDKVTEENLLD